MQEIDLIFQQHYRPLCLYATHYLHDIDEAEDVVQDCFVKLMSRSIMPVNIKAFLYTSVRNACIDRLRRQSPIDTEISPSDLSGTISDNQAQESSFREAELWTAIEKLPERCREIFLMSKRRAAGLMLHCEPGLCITPFCNDKVKFTEIKDAQGVGHPASYTDELYGNVTTRTVRNHGGKWLAWRIKSALTFRSGDVFLSLGWLTSDFNIENSRNNIRYTKGKRYNGIEKYKHTNTLFASITGQF